MVDEDANETDPPDEDDEPTLQYQPLDSVDRFMDSIVPDAHPETVGRYKIVEILGEGGMGVVYLAEQSGELRRKVALKLIKPGMDSRQILARFEGERQALAIMDHPNIARVHDAGVSEGGRPFFVMEYVRGVPLTEYCDAGRLGLADRLRIFVQICHGVQHAHYRGIIHRDLKPSNMLVTSVENEPLVKIIDFGVAKATEQPLTDATLLTEVGQILGTPGYMSPEQAEINTSDIDSRSDVYSLGVVLYELLVGVLPFDVRSLLESGYEKLFQTIREEDPLTPSTRLRRLDSESTEVAKRRNSEVRTLHRELRGDLDWITMKALEKQRDRRYATPNELADDIIRHLEDRPVLAGPPRLLNRAAKLVRRHRTVVGGAVLTLGTLLAVAILLYLGRLNSARDALDQAEAGLEQYNSRRAELQENERRWRAIRRSTTTWTPVWDRGDELAAYDAFRASAARVIRAYADMDRNFQKTRELAPPGTDLPDRARKSFAHVNARFYEMTLAEGPVELGPAYFQNRAVSLAPEEFSYDFGSVEFLSDPPGAEVFCFRYVERDRRLVPLTFDLNAADEVPADDRVGDPFLEIEEIWDAKRTPFRVGDRWLTVAGQEVSLPSDVARTIQKVETDSETIVRIRRDGVETAVSWIPFPSKFYGADYAAHRRLEAGRVQSIREQFGFTFRACPLEFLDPARLGETSEIPLRVRLPAGSYLFVFRKPGHAVTRYPTAVPPDHRQTVKLLKSEEVPEGYVHIPAGPCRLGDAEAYQSFRYGEKAVGDYLIGLTEITIEEYLEFVNARGDEVDEDGRAAPRHPDVAAEVRRYQHRVRLIRDGRVQIVPKSDGAGGALLFERDPGTRKWRAIPQDSLDWSLDWPVYGICHFAASEYGFWLSEKMGRNCRLPTDLEWEKAARGADRRPYVWGHYPLWSFCWSYKGIHHQNKWPAVVGASPADESVYGVRDLAGSVSECALDRPVRRYRYRSVRGANWLNTDVDYDRVAARNGRNPESTAINSGFRLVIPLGDE